jgi:hypothetical protein
MLRLQQQLWRPLETLLALRCKSRQNLNAEGKSREVCLLPSRDVPYYNITINSLCYTVHELCKC